MSNNEHQEEVGADYVGVTVTDGGWVYYSPDGRFAFGTARASPDGQKLVMKAFKDVALRSQENRAEFSFAPVPRVVGLVTFPFVAVNN